MFVMGGLRKYIFRLIAGWHDKLSATDGRLKSLSGSDHLLVFLIYTYTIYFAIIRKIVHLHGFRLHIEYCIDMSKANPTKN